MEIKKMVLIAFLGLSGAMSSIELAAADINPNKVKILATASELDDAWDEIEGECFLCKGLLSEQPGLVEDAYIIESSPTASQGDAIEEPSDLVVIDLCCTDNMLQAASRHKLHRACLVAHLSQSDEGAACPICKKQFVLQAFGLQLLNGTVLLNEDTSPEEMLRVAVRKGYIARVKELLLIADINVNEKVDKKTILHEAALLGNEVIVELLLTAGGKIIRDELLLSAGDRVISVDVCDRDSSTRLHIAAEFGLMGMAQKYITNFKDQDAVFDSPLHVAVRFGREAIVALLLAQSGINTELQNNKGRTPLHLAAQFGYKNIIEQLFAAWADKKAKDFMGFSPLDFACQYGDMEIAVLFGYIPGGNNGSCVIS